MLLLQVAILVFILVAGTGVVLTRDPSSQAIAVSFYGLLLALMFFLFQAPDVALSQIVVGSVALPLMILLALAKIRMADQDREKAEKKGRETSGADKEPQQAKGTV
jgi:energy-converting hydrogenase B subunit D